MALRQLVLSREAAALRSEQETLITSRAEIEVRRAAWREREARAEAALAEMTDETPEAERAAFDAECEEIEAENTAITADEDANNTRQGEIAARLAEIENELRDLEERARNKPAAAPATTTNINNEREGNAIMNTRTMKIRERILAAAGADITRTFGENIRGMKLRGVTNAELSIPVELLPMMQEMIDGYSKLKKYVRTHDTSGETRQTFLRGTPEGVWTESKASLNELDLNFSQITIDAYKVGGYIPIHNSTIEDVSNIAAIAMDALAQAIAVAEDKAILYGDGNKRPIGIMNRLAAKTKPTWWEENEGDFVDLSTTHIGHVNAATIEGIALFKQLLGILGKATKKYNAPADGLFWAMTRPTWMKLTASLLDFNSSGAIVSGMNMQMPVLGGDVVLLDGIMKADDIVGGYGSQYMWGDRNDIKLKVAEQTRAIEDQTLFIGTQRADGKPMCGEGFAAVSIGAEDPATSATFAEDKANASAAE